MVTENQTCFLYEASEESYKISTIIVGSYIGAEIAWLSCDVTSLLSGKALDDTTNKTPLSEKDRRMIKNEYGRYVKPGQQYRHENISLDEILKRYELFVTPSFKVSAMHSEVAAPVIVFSQLQNPSTQLQGKEQEQKKSASSTSSRMAGKL